MAADAAGLGGFSGAMEGNGHFERAATAEGALPVLSSVARFLAVIYILPQSKFKLCLLHKGIRRRSFEPITLTLRRCLSAGALKAHP
jgi:hypothetical protein